MDIKDFKENKNVFWELLILILASQTCIAVPGEVLNLLVHKEYLDSIVIAIMGIVAFYIGVSSYGNIKKQLKK